MIMMILMMSLFDNSFHLTNLDAGVKLDAFVVYYAAIILLLILKYVLVTRNVKL